MQYPLLHYRSQQGARQERQHQAAMDICLPAIPRMVIIIRMLMRIIIRMRIIVIRMRMLKMVIFIRMRMLMRIIIIRMMVRKICRNVMNKKNISNQIESFGFVFCENSEQKVTVKKW